VACDPQVLCGTGAGGCGAGAAAAATEADPQLLGVVVTIGDRTAVISFVLEPTLLNETGSDEIARGFANGMTFAGGGVALPDRTDGIGAPEREPVGGGFGVLDRGGRLRTSTEVASPTSTPRGTLGITRNCVSGSCAILGRDFRVLIARGDALQNNRHPRC